MHVSVILVYFNNHGPVYYRFMIKRAQGRKRFGMKNFKKRWFRLTNHEFTYQKSKGNKGLPGFFFKKDIH